MSDDLLAVLCTANSISTFRTSAFSASDKSLSSLATAERQPLAVWYLTKSFSIVKFINFINSCFEYVSSISIYSCVNIMIIVLVKLILTDQFPDQNYQRCLDQCLTWFTYDNCRSAILSSLCIAALLASAAQSRAGMSWLRG